MSRDSNRFSPRNLSVAVAVFIVVLGYSWFHLKVTFTGLTSPVGVDIAQVARNFSEGQGMTTKTLRPAAMRQLIDKGVNYDVNAFPDTMHPLGAVLPVAGVLAAIGLREADWPEKVYDGDMAVACFATACFLVSVFLVYALFSGLFDRKIAGFVAALMLLADLNWSFVKSGLPQMWALMLFCGMLLSVYQLLAAEEEGKKGWGWLILACCLLGLLALSEWMCLWLIPGFCVFLFFHCSSGGVKAGVCLGIALLIVGPWAVRDMRLTGSPFGAAYYEFGATLSGVKEEALLANYEAPTVPGNVAKIFYSTFYEAMRQIQKLNLLLGLGPIALAFFLALLQSFRRKRIATFRWLLLYLWLGAFFGMAFVAIPGGEMDPRQIHLLFGPFFAAYGLAFVSILWSRLEISAKPGCANLPLLGFLLLALLPPLGYIFSVISFFQAIGDRQPPTQGQIIRDINQMTGRGDFVLSDQPALVTWYARRVSILLPPNLAQLELVTKAAGGLRLGGLLFTEETTKTPLVDGVRDDSKREWLLLSQKPIESVLPSETLSPEKFTFNRPVQRIFSGETVYFTDLAHLRSVAAARDMDAPVDSEDEEPKAVSPPSESSGPSTTDTKEPAPSTADTSPPPALTPNLDDSPAAPASNLDSEAVAPVIPVDPSSVPPLGNQ